MFLQFLYFNEISADLFEVGIQIDFNYTKREKHNT